MSARETEAATAVLPLNRPSDDRGLLLLEHHLTDVWVAAMRTHATVHGALWSQRREDGGHAFHAVTETHIEIPLIRRRKGLHAAAHRMVRQGLEVR